MLTMIGRRTVREIHTSVLTVRYLCWRIDMTTSQRHFNMIQISYPKT